MADILFPDKVAIAGTGVLPGMVWRPGDPLKHLGPPEGTFVTGTRSRLFWTRCGLRSTDGDWQYCEPGQDDDCWCPGCLAQYGWPHTLEPM